MGRLVLGCRALPVTTIALCSGGWRNRSVCCGRDWISGHAWRFAVTDRLDF